MLSGHSADELMVGLNDPEGLSQSLQFCAAAACLRCSSEQELPPHIPLGSLEYSAWSEPSCDEGS